MRLVVVGPKYAHKVIAVYTYETLSETEWNVPNTINSFIPTVYNDIGKYIEIKKQALSYFKTQIANFPDPRSLEKTEAFSLVRQIC